MRFGPLDNAKPITWIIIAVILIAIVVVVAAWFLLS
jgi:hypothetical protein